MQLRRYFLGGLLWWGVTAGAAAQEVRIAAVEFAPFSMSHDSSAPSPGMGVEMAQALLRATQRPVPPMLPVTGKRLQQLMQEPQVLFPSLTRTPEREALVHWIGKVADDRNCFFTPVAQPVSTLEAARALAAVGVNESGVTHQFLQDKGFLNIEAQRNNTLNFKKIQAGRLPAWYTSALVSRYVVAQAQGDARLYVCSGSIKTVSYWLAASQGSDPAWVAQLRSQFERLERDGTWAQVRARYLP